MTPAEPTIPAPLPSDREINLHQYYRFEGSWRFDADIGGLIRRCHATEQDVKAKDAELAAERAKVAMLREALQRIASDEPFMVQTGGTFADGLAIRMPEINRTNAGEICKLLARTALNAATEPKKE